MVKKAISLFFVIMLVATLVVPAISFGGPPRLGGSDGFACGLCVNGDIWWCSLCLGVTHQQYINRDVINLR